MIRGEQASTQKDENDKVTGRSWNVKSEPMCFKRITTPRQGNASWTDAGSYLFGTATNTKRWAAKGTQAAHLVHEDELVAIMPRWKLVKEEAP